MVKIHYSGHMNKFFYGHPNGSSKTKKKYTILQNRNEVKIFQVFNIPLQNFVTLFN